mmetsp:Transcript_18183/g.57175  ORF Transcript_18183/g.57175 Transcript_18183/m.57175 type:complete len:263 (-) Transcript_18183:21-809(-)
MSMDTSSSFSSRLRSEGVGTDPLLESTVSSSASSSCNAALPLRRARPLGMSTTSNSSSSTPRSSLAPIPNATASSPSMSGASPSSSTAPSLSASPSASSKSSPTTSGDEPFAWRKPLRPLARGALPPFFAGSASTASSPSPSPSWAARLSGRGGRSSISSKSKDSSSSRKLSSSAGPAEPLGARLPSPAACALTRARVPAGRTANLCRGRGAGAMAARRASTTCVRTEPCAGRQQRATQRARGTPHRGLPATSPANCPMMPR